MNYKRLIALIVLIVGPILGILLIVNRAFPRSEINMGFYSISRANINYTILIIGAALILISILVFLKYGLRRKYDKYDILFFGQYNFHEKKEKIEWIVVDRKNSDDTESGRRKKYPKVRLMATNAIDYRQYDSDDTDNQWDNCELYKYLNRDILGKYFTEKERACILGPDEKKEISCLSVEEFSKEYEHVNSQHIYFPHCAVTDAAKSKALLDNNFSFRNKKEERNVPFWTSSIKDGKAIAVKADRDNVDIIECSPSEYNFVRPAIWLDLNEYYNNLDALSIIIRFLRDHFSLSQLLVWASCVLSIFHATQIYNIVFKNNQLGSFILYVLPWIICVIFSLIGSIKDRFWMYIIALIFLISSVFWNKNLVNRMYPAAILLFLATIIIIIRKIKYSKTKNNE